jgi:L,D-transpeptidase YcbB
MRKMSKLVPKLFLGLTVIAFGATEADAGHLAHKRRVGFFESLFGGATTRRQARPIFETSSDQKLTWFEQRQLEKRRRASPPIIDNPNGINILYSEPLVVKKQKLQQQKQQKQKEVLADLSEPDPLPGLGLGTVYYMPPLVVPVYDSSIMKLQAKDPESEAIRVELINKATKIRAIDVERKAIIAFYTSNQFEPIWTASGRVLPRATSMLKTLSKAGDDGLVAKNYLPTGLTSFDNVEEMIVNDAVATAQFDIAMTVATLKYARQMSGGQFDPNRLSLYNDIKPQTVSADEAMKVLGSSPFPEAYVATLVPQNPQYAAFKSAISKLSDSGKKSLEISSGPDLKVGNIDERIPEIRSRLQTLGVSVAELDGKTDPMLFDKKLASSVKKFQTANKIKASGIINGATLAALNADHSGEERQRLVINMERLRWLPKNLGSRYVFVNQPAYEVNVIDQGAVAWQSRVIIGKPMNQTYSFNDQIETVVFNPSWGVPASIIINEYGPKSRKDPTYLDRNGFKIKDAKGDEISSADIDWWGIGQAPKFGVQQPPGSDNALGELKFLFPNSHDIYMHDTPTKNLFTDSTRAYSHGCVRVQNPREFASVLLNMSEADVAKNLGPKAQKSKKADPTEAFVDSHSVTLAQKVPVYLTYFTAWTDQSGKIIFYNDVYGRDAAMEKAFAYDPLAKKPSDSGDIVTAGTISGDISQN